MSLSVRMAAHSHTQRQVAISFKHKQNESENIEPLQEQKGTSIMSYVVGVPADAEVDAAWVEEHNRRFLLGHQAWEGDN